MSEKINIDGVRFKVDANLDKLAEDLKKGEGVAKKGGEAMGKAAGKGFDQSLKSDVNKTLDDVKKTAESSSSALTGIFGKVGAAVAGAFALDKIIGFFSSAMEESEKLDEQLGRISKQTKEINDDFEEMASSQSGLWSKVKDSVGSVLNSIKTNLKAAVVAAVEFFTGQDPERIVKVYQRTRDGLNQIGKELDRLAGIQKRSAEEELQFIKLKDELSAKLNTLGISYNEAAKGAKNYAEAAQNAVLIEKRRAQARLYEQSQAVLQSPRALENFENIEELERLKRSGNGMSDRARYLAREIREYSAEIVRRQRLSADLRNKAKNIDDEIKKQQAQPASQSGIGQTPEEARFLDSRLRLETIERNREFTVDKAKIQTTGKERERRIELANEEARQAVDYEINSLRAGYAQFIEETHNAKMLAIKSEADNARKLSYELYEAELKQGKNLQKAKEENEKRIAKIREAETRKQAALTAESFAKTMQAANQIAAGLSQGGAAGVGATMAGGGALGSALTSGGIISGSSGVSRFLSASGIIGPLIGLGSSLASGLSGLFGKSEEERKREIETARAIAERQHQEQMLILEQQAQYQKAMLAIQEANSRTPFENLQRNLRLLDIKEQQAVLSGTPSDIARKQTLQSKLSAMQSILQSEGGKISADTLFSGTGTSPDELIQFLNTRKSQEAYVNSAVGAYNSAAGLNFQSFGTPEGVAALDNYFRSALGNIESNRANLPETFANMLADRLRQALGLLDYGSTRTQGFGGYLSGQLRSALDPGLGDSLLSEINRDTGIAENLLSVIEQSLQTQNEIKDATKRTAANTSRLVDTPNRSSSLIDISRGLTRSLGQVISGPDLTNTALPNGVRAAVLATDIQKSIQERAADGIDRLNDTARKQLELLAIMVTILKNPSNVSPLTVAQLEDLYRRSGIRIAA